MRPDTLLLRPMETLVTQNFSLTLRTPSEQATPRGLRRALDLLYLASAVLGGLTLVFICGTMLLQVGARLIGKIAGGTDEITAYACAAAAFLPLAHTFRYGDKVRLTLVLHRLGDKSRRRVELFALAMTAAFAAYGTFHFGKMVYESWLFGDMSQGLLVIPMWIPQLPLVFGIAVFAISLLDALVVTACGGLPSYRISDDVLHDIDTRPAPETAP
ncbi:TRAP transporter small permease [Celeribacter naphthalenivorans]|uniref:TRAP transporter small permease n=1 Tax=Celeribacter naphthalenivorans TaxID=1614694 RepID=UPI001CFA5112|nr:TRAP transporter small permease subunit [Celeribacter naphthalenivorans]